MTLKQQAAGGSKFAGTPLPDLSVPDILRKTVGTQLSVFRKLGIKEVVFDRNGYLYHGRIKALADGARQGGLNF